jgi:membrane-associated phospholipid phosphatase
MVSNTFVLAPLAPLGMSAGAAATADPLQRNLLYANAMESCGAFMFCMGVTMGLKALVNRPRPWVAYEGDLFCLQPVRSASFPSGHTSAAFALFVCLVLITPRKWTPLWMILAWATAYSRIYLSQHFLEDILFGSMIGMLCCCSLYIFQNSRPKLSFK